MSRLTARVRCDRRGREQHTLAVVKVADDGQVVVEARVATATTSGMAPTPRTYRESDLDGFTGMQVMVTCGCGVLYLIDLVEVMRGDRCKPRRVEPEAATGVSYNRRRPAL